MRRVVYTLGLYPMVEHIVDQECEEMSPREATPGG